VDNNNTNPPVEASPVVSPDPVHGSKKMIFWLILGIIILIIGGIGVYLSKQQSSTPVASGAIERATSQPQATITPTTNTDNLEQQVNLIDIQNPDSNFTQVDTDLQNI